MEISIVSGTYNRLPHMRKMVASVRRSVGSISYEIVLVDGGSTDGTVEWCEKQTDIKFIQQGELLGGIKAFNEGLYAATGRYAIVGNDDIEYVGLSILRAYTFMQDNPRVGVGCFYQDRNNKEMHVETMPAVVDGRKFRVYYGQVCIVPKHLGDKVGWWGDYNHTYGGDNELSCNILELGYRVEPIQCACIHDFQIDDELRVANKGYPQAMLKTGKGHPDSIRWRKKWTHKDGSVGPVVGSKAVRGRPDSLERYYRIYYAPIYEKDHKLQHLTKKTLRLELQKCGTVLECDYIEKSMDYILNSAYAFQPDLFLLQAQDSSAKFNVDTLVELKELCPRATFVMWNGDYHPKNLTNIDYMNMLKVFDLCGFATLKYKDLYDRYGINWMYLQAGFEDYPEADEPVTGDVWDFVFLGNGYSAFRRRLAAAMRSTGYTVGLYGMYPKGIKPNGESLYDYARNYKIYNQSKFAISDQQWPDSTGYVSDRIFHSMRSGVTVLQQYFDGMESIMGLKHGENCLVWKTVDDLKILMQTCMSISEKDRLKIGKAGQEHVRDNYHYSNFVTRMFKELGYE